MIIIDDYPVLQVRESVKLLQIGQNVSSFLFLNWVGAERKESVKGMKEKTKQVGGTCRWFKRKENPRKGKELHFTSLTVSRLDEVDESRRLRPFSRKLPVNESLLVSEERHFYVWSAKTLPVLIICSSQLSASCPIWAFRSFHCIESWETRVRSAQIVQLWLLSFFPFLSLSVPSIAPVFSSQLATRALPTCGIFVQS